MGLAGSSAVLDCERRVSTFLGTAVHPYFWTAVLVEVDISRLYAEVRLDEYKKEFYELT